MKNNVEKQNIEFFTATLSAWEAMLDDCRSAQKSIYFEQYILSDDIWGNRFLELFLEKTKEGLKVTLIFDFIGSMDIRNLKVIKELKEHGATVRFYRPLGIHDIFRPHLWFPRSHLKCMIIDHKIGYMGSACISQRMETWRDTYLRCVGVVVSQMVQEFNIEGKRKRVTPKRSALVLDRDFVFQLNIPRFRYNPVYDDLLKHINNAKETIYIATPYFIAPKKLYNALKSAAKRGVKVVVMASEVTDVKLADLAARADFKKYLNAGIQIYLFEPTILHAKYVTVDHKWATVGSTNIDYLSLHKNRESNVSVKNKKVVQTLESHFLYDMDYCKKIDLDFCEKRTAAEKIASYFARFLKKIL